uniref:Uncharacterized protein n=1 Tax=Sinocyclocheilus rhinocerous TaxID=307959 RepID=A0A673H0P6_9TELE
MGSTWDQKLIKGPQHTTSIIGMIDTFDRPPNTIAEGGYYAKQGSYALGFKDKSGIFEVEAKGPNASFDSEISVVKVEAMARAEVASASAKAGPVGVKVGLGFDTGVSVCEDGVETKFLGTGFSIGPKNCISLLGSEVSFM